MNKIKFYIKDTRRRKILNILLMGVVREKEFFF